MRFDICFGAGFTRYGEPLFRAEVDYHVAFLLDAAARRFGGANFTAGRGAWNPGKPRDLIREHSGVITIFTGADLADAIRVFALLVKDRLRQESVLVTASEATTESI